MAFWNKKKKASAEPAPQETAKKPAKKNAKETMASVIHESVPETAMEQFGNNTPFITNDGKFVGLWFETEQIGGLTKKSKKKEDIGSIIEAINGGNISALVTGECLAIECMVLIPNLITIDHMDEYGLLRGLSYKLCTVEPNCDISITDVSVTLPQCKAVLQSEITIDRILQDGKPDEEEADVLPDSFDEEISMEGDEDAPFGMEPVVDEPDDEGAAGTLPDVPEDTGSDLPFLAEEEDFDPIDGEDDYGTAWSGMSSGEGAVAEDSFAPEESDVDDEEGEEEDAVTEVLPASMFEQALTRKLYSDDLQLEVTTEPFDAAFLHTNSYVPFSEDRGAGWMNDYLNQMSRDANTDMKRMHQDHLLQMRTRYFNLVSKYCQDITSELDYRDASTHFGKAFLAIEDAREESRMNLDQTVSERRAAITEDFEKKAREAGEAAASIASHQYRERHGKQMEDRLHRIDPDVKAEIEDQYQSDIIRMNEDRKHMAKTRLDYGITAALSMIGEEYGRLLEEERSRYKEHQDAIMEFIDSNRKDEIARAKALAEELSQSEKADAVMAEYTAKVQHLTADFDARRQLLFAEVEQLKRKYADDLQAKDEEYRERLIRAKDENDTLQRRLDDAVGEIARLDDKKEAEYRARMDDLIGEREAMSQKYEHLADMQKKGSILVVTFATVGVITALVIGFVAGEFVNIKRFSTENQSKIAEEFQKKLDNLQFDLPDGWQAEVSADGTVRIQQTAPSVDLMESESEPESEMPETAETETVSETEMETLTEAETAEETETAETETAETKATSR